MPCRGRFPAARGADVRDGDQSAVEEKFGGNPD